MSVIDLAILGLLSDQELHGYELKKRLNETLGERSSVSFGSLYPGLNRLERMGSVKAVAARTDAPPMPMTGSLGAEVAALRDRPGRTRRDRRGKKVFGLTDRGRQHLADLLTTPATDERTFALQMAFCHQLDDDERSRLFEARRSDLAAALEERRTADHDRTRYARAHHEHQTAAIVQEIAWLDELLAEERSATADDDGTVATTTSPSGGTA